MQILKSATDKAIYERAIAGHDGTMTAYIQWYERGKTPKENRRTQYEKHQRRQAQRRVQAWREEYTAREIADHVGISQSCVYAIQHGTQTKVGTGTIRKVLDFEGTIQGSFYANTISEEEYRKAQEELTALYEREGNMAKLARRMDVDRKRLWKAYRDEYANPNEIAKTIINYNSTN